VQRRSRRAATMVGATRGAAAPLPPWPRARGVGGRQDPAHRSPLLVAAAVEIGRHDTGSWSRDRMERERGPQTERDRRAAAVLHRANHLLPCRRTVVMSRHDRGWIWPTPRWSRHSCSATSAGSQCRRPVRNEAQQLSSVGEEAERRDLSWRVTRPPHRRGRPPHVLLSGRRRPPPYSVAFGSSRRRRTRLPLLRGR
jgi:hypothetical protein